ncbi:MAG: PIG-L family deacetylase [Trueperaceae bacterium]|nr:PIG-L family deacetylase [Trueperaceae bacterium]
MVPLRLSALDLPESAGGSLTESERRPLRILCIGAHPDDIEIGAAGALLTLLSERPGCTVDWVVATSPGAREQEARASAHALLAGLADVEVHLLRLRESYLDGSGVVVKEAMQGVRDALNDAPDLILTHHRDDRHQDHRALSDITWNLWRDHLVLEYEVPKWDGDLSQPSVYVPLSEAVVERKLAHLRAHFASQRGKDWFDDDTFKGLMRLRGMECRSPSRYAEAFHGRKVVLAL